MTKQQRAAAARIRKRAKERYAAAQAFAEALAYLEGKRDRRALLRADRRG